MQIYTVSDTATNASSSSSNQVSHASSQTTAVQSQLPQTGVVNEAPVIFMFGSFMLVGLLLIAKLALKHYMRGVR